MPASSRYEQPTPAFRPPRIPFLRAVLGRRMRWSWRKGKTRGVALETLYRIDRGPRPSSNPSVAVYGGEFWWRFSGRENASSWMILTCNFQDNPARAHCGLYVSRPKMHYRWGNKKRQETPMTRESSTLYSSVSRHCAGDPACPAMDSKAYSDKDMCP